MSKIYLKAKVQLLRSEGYSYELIKQMTGVSKSTLCVWLKKIPFIPNSKTIERMSRGQIKSAETNRELKIIRDQKAKDLARLELDKISKRDLMMIGIGLYIGEGAKYRKGCIQFSNSDPKVISLAMNWFNKALDIPIYQFRAVIHIYPDNKIEDALKYWSKVTEIPINQFSKTYIDLRSNKSVKNKRKLPHGTLHIRIRALGNKEFGTFLYQKILSWIDIVENYNFAGIV